MEISIDFEVEQEIVNFVLKGHARKGGLRVKSHLSFLRLLVAHFSHKNKKAVGLMAQLMKFCQQHLSCLRRCFCFSS